MPPESPAALPAVPASLLTPPAGTRVPLQRTVVTSGPQPVKSVFDNTPAATQAARNAAAQARNSLMAAVRGVMTAQKSVADLKKLTDADPVAAVTAEHEGLTPDLVKQFTKLADPFVTAFTVPTPPAS